MPTIRGLHIRKGEEIPQNLKDAIGEDKIKLGICEKFNIQPKGSKVKVSKKEEVKVELSESYTEVELFAMNKKEQTKVLNDLGVKSIPLLEKNRVKKILELQGGQ